MSGKEQTELQLLGSFELSVLRDLLPALEAHAINFETGGDSAFGRQPMRYNGNNPSGPNIEVYVPLSKLEAARNIVTKLYPL